MLIVPSSFSALIFYTDNTCVFALFYFEKWDIEILVPELRWD